MRTRAKESIRATVNVRVVEPRGASESGLYQPRMSRVVDDAEFCGRLFEFAGSAPVTFAERFPRLMVFGIAAGFVVAAIAVEIECLRGAGFYWR